ncbi:type I-C CRISPR-associated protein Cas8c/Csd1, partial [bacterium]|nr:type I-C CRISPR-associated protein Cas8c/Csd1 [bacterium]
MILQSLVELYENLLNDEDSGISKRGWCVAKVSHCLCIDEGGNLLEILPLYNEVTRGKKMVSVPASLQVPEQKKRTSGVLANFLCDSASYLLGFCVKEEKDKETGEKTLKVKVEADKFKASCDEHRKILCSCSGRIAKAVLAFFDSWDINGTSTHPLIVDRLREICDSNNFVFRVNGLYAHCDEEIIRAWDNFALNGEVTENTELRQCLVTGLEKQPIERLHPSIKGVKGGQSSGASLVSFNCNCSESYGCDGGQGLNSPVSKYAAFAYGTALKYLLSQSQYVKFIGDATIVFWSEKDNKKLSGIFSACSFGDEKVSDDLSAFLDHIVKGDSVDVDGIEINPEEKFYILGLSPNGGRLSVRFFLVNTFGEVIRNLQAHQERLRIIRPQWEVDAILPIWKILKATVNPKSKDTSSSPLMSGSLFKAVLNNNNYPASFYLNILLRVFADKDVDYVKAASIKAYLLKNHNEKWRNV